jgi:hypothetical protein
MREPAITDEDRERIQTFLEKSYVHRSANDLRRKGDGASR